MSTRADTPTHEPIDGGPLTAMERAALDLRLAAAGAAGVGVPEGQALAEVRLAYRLVRSRFATSGIRP